MDSYIGEIRLFAGNYVPRGWALCDGSMLQVRENPALFAVIGNRFGGDGKTTFALPNFSGRVPMHQGAGPGLTPRTIAEKGGSATVTLNQTQIPNHTHAVNCVKTVNQSQNSPVGAVWSSSPPPPPPPPPAPRPPAMPLYSTNVNTPMSNQAISVAGQGQPHNNMQPYLGLRFIISLDGFFPVNPN